jgi:toxin HigB-1
LYLLLFYGTRGPENSPPGIGFKAFSGFERSARLKLDRIEAATSLRDLAALLGNRFEGLLGDRPLRATPPSASLISLAQALSFG